MSKKRPLPDMAIFTREFLVAKDGKFTTQTEEFAVKVLARKDGYAMVRRSRAIPFVVRARFLRDLP